MAEASCVEEAGDGTGATRVKKESAGRDGEAVEKESSTTICDDTSNRPRSKSNTAAAAAAATAVEPGDRRRKEGERGENTKGRDKARGERRSRSETRSSMSAAVPKALAAEVDKKAGEASALLASPSTKRRSDTNSTRSSIAKTEENGDKKKKERRRRSSKPRASSDIPSRTSPVRKPSKDDGSNRYRTRSSSSHSSDLIEAQRQAQEPTVAHTAHVPSSVPDSKRRKRTRSSRTLSVDDDDGDPAGEEPSTVHSGGSSAKRAYCPNATSSTTGKGYDDARSNSGAASLAPSHDFPTAVAKNTQSATLAAEPEPAPEYDEHPTGFVSQRRNGTLGTEPSSSGGEGGGTAAEGRGRSGRQNGSTRWRGDEATQENIKRKGKSNLTEGDVSRRHSNSSSSGERTRGKRAAGATTGVAVNPSPSPSLGVKVIDEGATKQLVLTADGRGKPGSSEERSRGATKSSTGGGRSRGRSRPAQRFDVIHSQHDEKNLLHRRGQFPLDPGEEERSRAFRDTFAKAVLAAGGEEGANPPLSTEKSEYLADAVVQGVVNDETTTRASYQQTAPAGRSPPVEAANKQHPGPTHHHHRDEHAFVHSRKEKVSASIAAACTSSMADSQRMAPSFSVIQKGNNYNHNNNNGIKPSSPTTSTSSSSFLDRPDHERTAKYVPEQASFHADISDNYIDLDSPLGEVGGERAGKEVGNGDRPRVASNSGMGVTPSRPPAESFSCNSVSMVDDSRPGKTYEQQKDPVVLSLRQSPEVFGGRNSQNGREDDRPEVPTNTAQMTPAFPNPLLATDPERGPRPAARCETEVDVSSSMPSTVLQVSSLAGEDGNARLDPDQQQHFGRGATPPLSQDLSESARRSKEVAGRSVEDGNGLAGDLVHFRTDTSRHLVCGERPELFFLRPNESLAVTRIEGAGRLLVTLREEAGAGAVVVIDGATVHDSAAHFGHAAIQTDHRFPYVAGHRYEFQVVSAQGVELAVRGGGDRQGTAAYQGSKGKTPTTGLHVVFSVTSAYTKGARLCHEDAVRFSLPTFEATPAYNFQQPREPHPSPATTNDIPPTTSACSAATESNSATLRPPKQNPGSAGDRRPPSPSVAMALMAPCLSPPPVDTEHPAATRPSVEISAPTGAPATAAVPSNRTATTVEGSSNGVFVRGEPLQNTAPGDHGDQWAGVKRRDQHRPGYGDDSERRDSRERTTGGNERYLRKQSSPTPPKAGSPRTTAAGQADWENRDPVKNTTGGGRSTRIVMAASPAADPYIAQQRRERGADRTMVMVGRESPSTGRLRWNPAWEQQRLPPSSPEPAQAPPPSHRSTLPYIQRHVDNTSPRSAFGHQDYTPRDTNVGADRFIRPPGYYAHQPPTQGRRHEVAGGAEDQSHLRYHRPIREQQHQEAPRHSHRGNFSDGQRDMESPGHHGGEAIGGRGGVFNHKVEWNQRRYPDKHSPVVIGTDHQFKPGNRSTWGGNDGQHQTGAGDNRRSRWREEDDGGWSRNGRPDLRRKSEQDVHLTAGYGYKPATGGGLNGEEEPPHYRSDHRGRRNKVPSLPDSRRGGYKHGGGLPPSGKPCWEPTKTAAVAAAQSDPSRGSAAATGRGEREGPPGDELAEQEAYYVRKRGGYSGPLAADRQARRGVDNVGGSESDRRKRTPQHAHNEDHHQPPAYRKSQHDNTGGGGGGGSGAATSATTERMAPRWIKF